MRDGHDDAEPLRLRWQRWSCVVIAIVGVVCSVVAAGSARDLETTTVETGFELDAMEREAAIEHRIGDATEVLHALSTLYAAVGEVDAAAFHAFVSQELERHESVRAMGWNPVVPHVQRAAFEAAARRDDAPDFRITESSPHGEMVPAAEAEEYVVVRHIEPLGGNENALGFNVRSEARRREALERARDTGQLAITAPISLVQDREQRPGFLGFVPHYGSASPATVAERRASIRGYVVAVFQAGTMVDAALASFDRTALNAEVYDVTGAEPVRLAFAGPGPGPGTGTSESGEQRMVRGIDLDVGGRKWRLNVSSTPSYVSRRRTKLPGVTLTVGLVITALLTGFLILLLRGVADRDRARLEVVERERRLRLTLDAVADGAWDWNISTGVVAFSDSWLAGLGYRREDVEDRVEFWESALHPDDVEAVQQALGEHFAGRTATYECENRLRRADGEYSWNLDRGRVVERAEDGTPLRMVGTDTDITARKAAEHEKQRLERRVRHTQKLESLGVLAGGIAHDFNNLLVAVIGSADLALKRLPSDARSRPHIERIKTAGSRAAELTRQMLAYAGGGRLVAERIDLTEVVREMLSLLRASISKKAELVCELASGGTGIDGDATQLRQVVMNLITNASDSLESASGTIHVRTGVQSADAKQLAALHLGGACPPGNYAFVEVADTGVGMGTDVRDRMFDPFFSTKFHGRGLGLAAVIGIVSSHAGAIGISTAPREGTTIRVLFPISDAPVVARSPEDESITAWRASGIALVVDDEEPVREVARAILESCGFRVLTAADGLAAVEMFREHAEDIDVVVLDMSMPRMDGAEAFRRIRGMRPGARVVFSTGFGRSDSVQDLQIDERVGFIGKPYRASEFLERIRATVEA